jgi:D-serine deaminase-like pyridoxal phosphate-dependent protein
MASVAVGSPLADIDTPALLIDIDSMDRNIAHIAGVLAANGVAWRPHAKGHKSPAIAHRQLAAGAIGVTCAKLGEAVVLAAAGVRSILIANQVVGRIKTRRLAALIAASGAEIIVAVDGLGNVHELDAAARERGVRIPVVIEVNTGMNRAGVAPGEPVVALAKEIVESPSLRFAGVMAWEGHAMGIADSAERQQEITAAVERLTSSAAACREAGMPVEIVSCGGSGTYLTTGTLPGVTEVQAGGATLGDSLYRTLGAPIERALSLLVQVTSRPTPERIIIDAGRKSTDPGLYKPVPIDLDGVVEVVLSAEHGRIELDRPSTLKPGDRLELEIAYHDHTVHLHDELYVVRNGEVIAVWPVAGRGKDE